MNEWMINVDQVSKQYRLGQIGGTTLREELQRLNARIRHREDPTKKIGAKEYRVGETFLALDHVSLKVKKGERVGIIGHNGAGKSTLLKLLSRVTAPTKGTIGLNGRVASMLEVGTGFHRELTGRENIYMNGAILGMTRKEIDRKIEDIIEFSECRQFIDTPVKRYSSGMYVKLAFSVAAHLDSEIMIMDEVLAVGDMAFQQKCLKKMNDVSRKEGRTILYVSHNMNTIRQLCDRCVVLDHGMVVFDGDVDSAIDQYMGIRKDSAMPVKYDLSIIPRLYHFGQKVMVTGFEFINKKEPVYTDQDEIECRVTLRSKIDIDSARIAMSVKDSSYAKIGLFLSEPFSIREGESMALNLSIQPIVLAPGIYSFNPYVLLIGAGKETITYDDPGAKVLLQIDSPDEMFVWHKEWWGNARLGRMKTISMENNIVSIS